ncbi:MAG: hypothetical protein Q4G24_01100 [Paracoccus sp. (in: a-proteobacteria)]|uniref:hypothetical protein n=1 Tax=Paracoccus sp. TaxID=267 RepID=UPI0026E0AF63|nr:hypothetical protein [Paracoccus sp. (in: a-proteobacteria)]MDO5620046.1 hypothetical protein [Paracoccus sp. (in: a-proteobacteria)]
MKWLAILAALTGPAAAQSVGPCGEWAAAENIAEPWEDNTDTFANGAVRVALLDVGEPALAAEHLLILSPPFDLRQMRRCRVVSAVVAPEGGWPSGFFRMDFAGRKASYDPATGLKLVIPVALPEDSTDGVVADGFSRTLTVTIPMNSDISARLVP